MQIFLNLGKKCEQVFLIDDQTKFMLFLDIVEMQSYNIILYKNKLLVDF